MWGGEAYRLYFLTGSALTEVTDLPAGCELHAISGAWSADGSRFAIIASRRPAKTAPRDYWLLLVPADPGGTGPVVSVSAPEGYHFDSMCPLSWVGDSHVLAVAYPVGHWSDGPFETWACCFQTP